jgi:hypothetical protein
MRQVIFLIVFLSQLRIDSNCAVSRLRYSFKGAVTLILSMVIVAR